jgi:hypothetical protein
MQGKHERMHYHKLSITNRNWRNQLIWILKANLLTWSFNALLYVILIFSGFAATNLAFSGYFSKITLLETGISFLIGGVIAFSGSVLPSKAKEYALKSEERWSIEKLRKNEKRANKYIIFAVLMLVESIVTSFFGI